MQGYKKVLKKTVGGFLALYLIMMGIFTFCKQRDIKQEYRNYTYKMLNSLKDEIKRVVENFDKEEDIIRELNVSFSDSVASSDEFQVYASAGVFKHRECLAKSGNYLENGGLDNNLGEIPGGEKYIDLEKYFSQKELARFINQYSAIEEDKNKVDRIEVEGYSKGSEVIPKMLRYYTIEQRLGESGWHDEDAVLAQEYQFNIEDKEKLNPYKGDFWRLRGFRGGIGGSVLKTYRLTPAIQAHSQNVQELMFEWSKKDGWDWQEGGWEKTYTTYQRVETIKGTYGLALAVQYNPWSSAIINLGLVYIFSGISTILMLVILARGIWNTYKKQQCLEKNRREFVDAIAHELKTPLGIIQAYGEGLKEKIAEDKRGQYLDVIIDETTKMNELILEMLELSRLENKAYNLKLERFSMQKLIGEVVKNKIKLIKDKQIEIVFQIEGEWKITADYRCMNKVVSNLLLNAIQHTETGRKIYISIVEGRVAIANEGLCIPEEKLDVIWDAFYKIEEINNRAGKGNGLGLAIVRNMLVLHHMSFGVVNMEDGVKFWFDIREC